MSEKKNYFFRKLHVKPQACALVLTSLLPPSLKDLQVLGSLMIVFVFHERERRMHRCACHSCSHILQTNNVLAEINNIVNYLSKLSD